VAAVTLYQSTGSPLAEEALRRIGELYRIEAEIRGRPAEERRRVRQERSKPLVEALHAWLTIQLERVSGRSTVSEEARRPVKESDILHGLLVLGENADSRQLLDAVRHAAFDVE